MPIVTSALLPNSLLLLPGLTPQVRERVTKSRAALQRLAKTLLATQPEVIMYLSCVSPELKLPPYAMLQARDLHYEHARLGDPASQDTLTVAQGFTHHLKQLLETSFPMPLVTVPELPLSFSLAVSCLGQAIAKVPSCCLVLSNTPSPSELQNLGSLLAEQLANQTERCVLIALGNLSQHNTPSGVVYDRQFQKSIASGDRIAMENLGPGLRHGCNETLWAPAVVLLYAWGETKTQLSSSSYEAPFGTGWLVAQLVIA